MLNPILRWTAESRGSFISSSCEDHTFARDRFAHLTLILTYDLKVDTINAEQVMIFNDFVVSQWFSDRMHALPSMNSLL